MRFMKTIITHSPAETKEFAQSFAKNLKGGEVLGLVGELGAGKTVFVQGLAEALGVKEIVNSPTFVLLKAYPILNPKSSILNLVHIDAYRLDFFEQLKEIGVEEYLNKKDCLVVVEWADRVPEIKKYLKYRELLFKEGKIETERIVKT